MPYFVYIMANRPRGTLYVGVTNNPARRSHEHRLDAVNSFSRRYGIRRLVYLEAHDEIQSAIRREKLLKRWRRQWKIALVEKDNPRWDDLFDQLNR